MRENPRIHSTSFMEFRDQVKRHLNLDGTKGLEIGPFDRPVFTKAEASVVFVDYRTTDEARAYAIKAAGHDPEFVVPTDYVVGDAGEWTEVPNDEFDWIISCHALEHCPNLIMMLQTIGSKLKPGGLLISNLPDKRATFDVFRPLSTLGQIVEDFLLDRRRPSVQAVFDHVYYAAQISQTEAWTQVGNTVVRHNKNFAFALSEAKAAQERYYDAHRYVFTSDSFSTIVTELCESKIIPFSVLGHEPTKSGAMSFASYLTRIG